MSAIVADYAGNSYRGGVVAVTVGFSIQDEDKARLNHLVGKFGHGNRSAFLREAMRQMESVELEEEFLDLQDYWCEKARQAGVTRVDVDRIVRDVLSRSAARD